jgi:hypothetical protein
MREFQTPKKIPEPVKIFLVTGPISYRKKTSKKYVLSEEKLDSIPDISYKTAALVSTANGRVCLISINCKISAPLIYV